MRKDAGRKQERTEGMIDEKKNMDEYKHECTEKGDKNVWKGNVWKGRNEQGRNVA